MEFASIIVAAVLGLVTAIDVLYSLVHKVPVLTRGILEAHGWIRGTFKRSTKIEGLLVTFSLGTRKLGERMNMFVEVLSRRGTDYYCELRLDCDSDIIIERPLGPIPGPASNSLIDSLDYLKNGEIVRRSYTIRPLGKAEKQPSKRQVKLSMLQRDSGSEILLGHLEFDVG
jgi:hypothetical protein